MSCARVGGMAERLTAEMAEQLGRLVFEADTDMYVAWIPPRREGEASSRLLMDGSIDVPADLADALDAMWREQR